MLLEAAFGRDVNSAYGQRESLGFQLLRRIKASGTPLATAEAYSFAARANVLLTAEETGSSPMTACYNCDDLPDVYLAGVSRMLKLDPVKLKPSASVVCRPCPVATHQRHCPDRWRVVRLGCKRCSAAT